MSQLSTENISILPKPKELRMLCKRICVLEAIISPEWDSRYYSYQKSWGDAEEVCEMRNGEGDNMLILFSDKGTCVNGFAHESQLNGWRKVIIEEKKSFTEKLFGAKEAPKSMLVQEIANGIVNDLPVVFKEFIYGEPIKSIGTTFCIWQTSSDTDWRIGTINLPNDDYKDGSADLLRLLDGKPESYKNWAEEYYEIELDPEVVDKIYNGSVVTQAIIEELNPDLSDYEQLKADLDEIGYEYKI